MTESFNTENLDKDEQQKLYDQARLRGSQAGNDLEQSYVEDNKDHASKRTVSSTPLLEAIHDIELEETIMLNPKTSPEHKKEMMVILERIRESEAKSRERKNKTHLYPLIF